MHQCNWRPRHAQYGSPSNHASRRKGRRWWFALVDLIRVLRVVCDSYNQLAPDARSLVHYSLRTAVRNSFIPET